MQKNRLSLVKPELREYIHSYIFPLYAENDAGHQLDHVEYVIRRSLAFMEQFENLEIDMVYAAAAYHDTAHHIDKNRHEVLSANIFFDDEAMKAFFTDNQRQTVKEAIEDHRASLERSPRSDYGKILSSADRSTDVDTFIRRTCAYTIRHFPEYSDKQKMERCYRHMGEKYGRGGYAKSYVADAEYTRFCQEMQQLLCDRQSFEQKYRAVTADIIKVS